MHLQNHDPVRTEQFSEPRLRDRWVPMSCWSDVHVGPVIDLGVQAGVFSLCQASSPRNLGILRALGDLVVDALEVAVEGADLEDERRAASGA